MKLLQQLRNFTGGKFHIAVLLATAVGSGQDLVENTLKTGENLFSAVPAAVITAGAAGSFFAFKVEASEGSMGFLPGEPFNTFDRVDNFLFSETLPISAASLWIAGKLSDSDQMESVGEELCRGLFYTYGIVQTVKITAARTRPDGSNNRSFPSGHAAGASCLAAVLWSRYGPEVGLPFSGLAIYTCASRVNMGKHFLSDVVLAVAVGAACGIASSMVTNNQEGAKFSFSLSVDTEGRLTPGLW